MNNWDLLPISLPTVVAITIASQILAAAIVDHLSYDQLENWRHRLRPRAWEQDGVVYQRWFKVKSWKPLIPEAGATSPYKFRKKRLQSLNDDYLHQFILESIRAELCHELAIVMAVPIVLACTPQVAKWLILYTVVMNVPCAIIQRYNRPRLERVLRGRNRNKGPFKGLPEPVPCPTYTTYEKQPRRRFFRSE